MAKDREEIPEHGETDDEAPPQWEDQPAREQTHDGVNIGQTGHPH